MTKEIPSTHEVNSQERILAFKKRVIFKHTLMALGSSMIAYYFNPAMGKAVFFSSLVFHVYLRLLVFTFAPLTDNEDPRNRSIIAVFSGIRAALAALFLAILILQFHVKLTGIVIAFLVYKVVLLLTGLEFSSKLD